MCNCHPHRSTVKEHWIWGLFSIWTPSLLNLISSTVTWSPLYCHQCHRRVLKLGQTTTRPKRFQIKEGQLKVRWHHVNINCIMLAPERTVFITAPSLDRMTVLTSQKNWNATTSENLCSLHCLPGANEKNVASTWTLISNHIDAKSPPVSKCAFHLLPVCYAMNGKPTECMAMVINPIYVISQIANVQHQEMGFRAAGTYGTIWKECTTTQLDHLRQEVVLQRHLQTAHCTVGFLLSAGHLVLHRQNGPSGRRQVAILKPWLKSVLLLWNLFPAQNPRRRQVRRRSHQHPRGSKEKPWIKSGTRRKQRWKQPWTTWPLMMFRLHSKSMLTVRSFAPSPWGSVTMRQVTL